MDRYEKIRSLPHHVSEARPHLSMESRAAQFSPFAALTGYEELLEESDRTVEQKRVLSEEEALLIGQKLFSLSPADVFTLTYFVSDGIKEGGQYVTFTGTAKKADADTQTLLLSDGTRVAFADIYSLNGI